MKYIAYWLDPYGTIIPLTAERHVIEIIEHPEKFGLTEKEMRAVYKKHKEKWGSEGNAREEIMAELIKKGWVRIRYIRQTDAFTIQLWKLDSRQKENLYDWAKVAVKDGDTSEYTEVYIMEIRPGGDSIRGSVDDIIHFKLFQESKRTRKPNRAVVFIDSYIART